MLDNELKENQKPWESFPVITREKVRWRDLDSYGHINNGVYFSYFEQGRISYFSKIPELLRVLEKKEGASPYVLILLKTSADFKSQGFLNDKLVIATKVEKVKRSFIYTVYSIYNEDTTKLIAKGSAVLLLIKAESLKPVSITKEIIERIEKIETGL